MAVEKRSNAEVQKRAKHKIMMSLRGQRRSNFDLKFEGETWERKGAAYARPSSVKPPEVIGRTDRIVINVADNAEKIARIFKGASARSREGSICLGFPHENDADVAESSLLIIMAVVVNIKLADSIRTIWGSQATHNGYSQRAMTATKIDAREQLRIMTRLDLAPLYLEAGGKVRIDTKTPVKNIVAKAPIVESIDLGRSEDPHFSKTGEAIVSALFLPVCVRPYDLAKFSPAVKVPSSFSSGRFKITPSTESHVMSAVKMGSSSSNSSFLIGRTNNPWKRLLELAILTLISWRLHPASLKAQSEGTAYFPLATNFLMRGGRSDFDTSSIVSL